MYRYGTGTLTKVFVDRVFQECLTYDGEVVNIFVMHLLRVIEIFYMQDYKTYLDFVLAMENRKEPQVSMYFLLILT